MTGRSLAILTLKNKIKTRAKQIDTGNEAIELSWFKTQQFGKRYAILWQFLT